MLTPILVAMKCEHELFCYELLKQNFNQTRAYMTVYPGTGYEAARRSASLLMTNPDVRALINDLKEQRIAEVGVEINDIVRKLYRRAAADPSELMEVRRTCCRYCWGIDNQYQHTPAEWRELMERYRAAVVRAEANGGKVPDEPPVRGGVGFDKRMPPNDDCPECFGEGVEDILIKDTRNLSPEARELYAGVKQTRNGIEVLTNSQDAALEKLGRHLAMFTDNLNHKNNGGSFKPMTLEQFYQQPAADDDEGQDDESPTISE